MSGRRLLSDNELRALVALSSHGRAGTTVRALEAHHLIRRGRGRLRSAFDGLSDSAIRGILQRKLVPLAAAERIPFREHRFGFRITAAGSDDLAGRDLVALGLSAR